MATIQEKSEQITSFVSKLYNMLKKVRSNVFLTYQGKYKQVKNNPFYYSDIGLRDLCRLEIGTKYKDSSKYFPPQNS